jgi:DNA-binding MurR/RpiR family transcriptional regulator
MEKISDTLQSMDPIAFEAAVNVILEAKTIYIVGIRSCEPLADFLSF